MLLLRGRVSGKTEGVLIDEQMDFTVSCLIFLCMCVCVCVCESGNALSWGAVPGVGVCPDLGCDVLAKSPDQGSRLAPGMRSRDLDV